MNRHGLALATFASLVPTLAGAQTTWYVDAAGTPPGSGTPGDPFTTIQLAHDNPAVERGDTILVAPGTYVENPQISKRVFVVASGGPAVTEIAPAGPGDVVVLAGISQNQTLLAGFSIRPPLTANAASVYLASATLSDCALAGDPALPTEGVALDPAATALVRHVTVTGHDVGVHGLSWELGCELSVQDSILWGNGLDLVWEPGPPPIEHNLIGVGCQTYFDGPCLYVGPVGGTNPSVDPLFWGGPDGDLHLRPSSPAIGIAGDGSDVGAFPYGAFYMPAPATYCTAKLTADGCLAAVFAQGAPCLNCRAPFVIGATDVPNNRTGLLFYGYGAAALPFQGGTLCVQPPLRRTPVQFSGGNPPPAADCSGAFAFQFNLWILFGSDPGLVPGVVGYAQHWFRDPLDPTGFGVGLSDALWFGIAF